MSLKPRIKANIDHAMMLSGGYPKGPCFIGSDRHLEQLVKEFTPKKISRREIMALVGIIDNPDFAYKKDIKVAQNLLARLKTGLK